MRMVAALQYTMFAPFGKLVGGKHAAKTHDTTVHVQRYERPDVFFFKRTAFELIAGGVVAMFVA